MNGPPDPRERRPRPVPPRRPVPPPQRPPEQPWYLEFRRPPPPPPRISPPPPAPPPPAQPPTKPPAAQPPSNRGLLLGAAVTGVLALALLVILVLRGTGGSGPVELDVLAAQDGVRQVLTDPVNGYGREGVTGVSCNNGANPRVRRGATFTCAVTVDGTQRQVLVEFVDDAGTYAVDRPR